MAFDRFGAKVKIFYFFYLGENLRRDNKDPSNIFQPLKLKEHPSNLIYQKYYKARAEYLEIYLK